MGPFLPGLSEKLSHLPYWCPGLWTAAWGRGQKKKMVVWGLGQRLPKAHLSKECPVIILENSRTDLDPRSLSKDDLQVSENILNHWRPIPKSPSRLFLSQNLQWLPIALQLHIAQWSINHPSPWHVSWAPVKSGCFPRECSLYSQSSRILHSIQPSQWLPVCRTGICKPEAHQKSPKGLSQVQVPGSCPQGSWFNCS